MIVVTPALIAILRDEPEAMACANAIEAAPHRRRWTPRLISQREAIFQGIHTPAPPTIVKSRRKERSRRLAALRGAAYYSSSERIIKLAGMLFCCVLTLRRPRQGLLVD